MSNAYNALPNVNGTQPIAPTGQSKMNAEVDAVWYTNRGMQKDDKRAFPGQGDLVFIVANRKPDKRAKRGLNVDRVPAIATFNNALHYNEADFVFFGVAVNEAEHARRNGPLGAQFAVQIGGTRTILLRSMMPVGQGARLMWSLPRQTADSIVDPYGAGRLLAEIHEYKPGMSVARPNNLHSMMARSVRNMKIADADKRHHQAAYKMFEALLHVAYTVELARRRSENGGNDVNQLEKMQLAEQYGLVKARGGNVSTQNKRNEAAMAFQKDALDDIFGMAYNETTGKSHKVNGRAAFELAPMGTAVSDPRTQDIARQQAGQMSGIIDVLLVMYDEEQRRIIGYTPTGGFPGRNIDTILSKH